jgi:hypothetical protein
VCICIDRHTFLKHPYQLGLRDCFFEDRACGASSTEVTNAWIVSPVSSMYTSISIGTTTPFPLFKNIFKVNYSLIFIKTYFDPCVKW